MKQVIFNIYRNLFAKKRFRKLNSFLFNLSARGLGLCNFENHRVSGERNFVFHVLPKIINNKQPVFVDVGANVGNYSALLSESIEDVTIYAIEPHPKNYQKLKEKGLQKVKCINLAVGDKQEKLVLFDRADLDGSSHASLHRGVISEILKVDTVEVSVNVDTLDNIAGQQDFDKIDFLKIDTEGNELAVLKGAKSLIDSDNIKCIQFEFNVTNIVSRSFFRDFQDILHNFSLFRLLPTDLLPLDDYSPMFTEMYVFQNIIAIHKSIDLK